MGAEIVHDQHIAWPEFGTENLVQEGKEDLTIRGCLDGHRGQHALVVHRAQDRDDLPVPTRHGIDDALSTKASAIEPGHLRGHAALVEVDQPVR